jgi:hypothetical protein
MKEEVKPIRPRNRKVQDRIPCTWWVRDHWLQTGEGLDEAKVYIRKSDMKEVINPDIIQFVKLFNHPGVLFDPPGDTPTHKLKFRHRDTNQYNTYSDKDITRTVFELFKKYSHVPDHRGRKLELVLIHRKTFKNGSLYYAIHYEKN